MTIGLEFLYPANEPVDPPPEDHFFIRVKEMRKAGASLDDAVTAVFAEGGKPFTVRHRD